MPTDALKQVNDYLINKYYNFTKTEKSESLDTILDQQHRDQAYLLHIYDRMRSGQNILLAAAFTILIYLYSLPSNGNEITNTDRFFIPDEDYGKVIYFIAGGFFIFGIIKLMINVFGNHPWITSYEITKDNYTYELESTKAHYKKRNDICLEQNAKSYFKHKLELTYLFYIITITAIVLIVIKSLT